VSCEPVLLYWYDPNRPSFTSVTWKVGVCPAFISATPLLGATAAVASSARWGEDEDGNEDENGNGNGNGNDWRGEWS